MARCKSCSAPLPANTNICSYCMVRNDVDLHSKYDFSVTESSSGRICPDCDINLTTIELNAGEALYIERCDQCFGLFFDTGELELFLQNTVTSVFEINREQLHNINQERYQFDQKVSYKKCPECRDFMQRKNYGHKSGIVIDRCPKHGLWLDNGEITHLMEWRKAGGQLLHEKIEEQNARNQTAALRPDAALLQNGTWNDMNRPSSVVREGNDLIDTIGSLLGRLFS